MTSGNIEGPESPFYGRGGWTWYTGSASWLFKAGLEWILGVRPSIEGLIVDPCIPPSWDLFTVHRRFRGADYDITVRNPAHVECGVREITVDGVAMPRTPGIGMRCSPCSRRGASMQLRSFSERYEMKRVITALALLLLAGGSSPAQTPIAAILDTIQHTAFNYFWYQANPANGLIKDRSTSSSPCSIASEGFGLSAICIGVDHGWVSRAAARDRVLTALKTFWYGPQGSGDGYTGNFGLFYHMLDMNTSTRSPGSELSTIDTGLLLAGIIDAKQYFNGTDSLETVLRAYADSIYLRMQWSYMRGPYPFGLALGWMPGTGFNGYGEWQGYSEASIMYILAMGSPSSSNRLTQYGWLIWTSTYPWFNYDGYQYVAFPPLFGHQYSQCWLDLRSVNDDKMTSLGLTYFENSRRATLAQRAYARTNPFGWSGYSDSLWGLTASDAPTGYAARGAPPAQDDDGTITPTAPVSSIPFAPDPSSL